LTSFNTTGFALADWQERALEAWTHGDGHPYRGTLEIFTGGGKTLIALAGAARASVQAPDLKVAIVIPTEALARQWIAGIAQYTDIDPADVGLLGAGGKDDLADKRVLVCVLNTAAKVLPEMAENAQPLMLIVDECHRAGAPTVSRVLNTKADFRMGLSATPDRQEFSPEGEPLSFKEQRVGLGLGAIVFTFDLKQARALDWLPKYEIHHHGLTLLPEERLEYASISRRVDDAGDQLRGLGVETARAQSLQGQPGEVGNAARTYVALTSKRKDLLYRARERSRVAVRIVTQALAGAEHRILLFHERVDQAVELHGLLERALPDQSIMLEHSRLPTAQREAAMAAFRSGASPVLVSVKSLVEGIDVPAADMGVSVASSASVRQRIQALGRVLRRNFEDSAGTKRSQMHVIYMADTVDELIYAKEDWSDLTGEVENSYWLWSDDPDQEPALQEGPPATPRPSEEQEWDRLERVAPTQPTPWLGMFVGQEYSMDTTGTVRNTSGATMQANPKLNEVIERLGPQRFGRFRVTPKYNLVLAARRGDEGTQVSVLGQLSAPLSVGADRITQSAEQIDTASLTAGDPYLGPLDSDGGTFFLRQKRGGVIERKIKGGSEFALLEGTEDPVLGQNAKRILASWRSLNSQGTTIHINGAGHAWFEESGQQRFLADVPGGLAWPSGQSETGR